GCATVYSPPPLPENQMAYVKEMELGPQEPKALRSRVVINRIDGIGTSPAWGIEGGLRTFKIAPGKRTLDVMLKRNLGVADALVSFVAEAGKTYRVMGQVIKQDGSLWKRVHIYVEDDATGKNVSDNAAEKSATPRQ
ncbi:MAG: hypothetical protein NTY53_14090, partial [Kiritimatiellaeota bacterium]|nr:hypothetical protein [Kiritimatiellota bacterium]